MPIGLYGPQNFQLDTGGVARYTRVDVLMADSTSRAQLFTDGRGISTAPNPVFTDQYGDLTFYAEYGEYDLHCLGVVVRVSVDSGGGGGGSTGNYFHHDQPIANDTWTIPHGFGHSPGGILAQDNQGHDLMWMARVQIDSNTTQLKYSSAVAGQADCCG